MVKKKETQDPNEIYGFPEEGTYDWNLTPINPEATMFMENDTGAIFSLENSPKGKYLKQLNKGLLKLG